MPSHPCLSLSPTAALFDRDVAIGVDGARPGQRLCLRARCLDDDGVTWGSEAVFVADGAGRIDPATIAPEHGTYAGIDPMGLFWSMRPVEDGAVVSPAAFEALQRSAGTPALQLGRPALMAQPATPISVTLLDGDSEVAAQTFTQKWIEDGVDVRCLLEEAGLAARVYTPNGPPKAGMITITGSNGGYELTHAPLLASHGYLTMSLALFAAEGVPEHMVALPVEYMERALDWMAEALGHRRVGMIGWSKGAESVLIAASYLEDKVAAVASCLPCHVIMNGTDGSADYDHVGWTWQGQPLPYHLLATPEEAARAMAEIGYRPGMPLPLRPAFELGYRRVAPEAIIPLERARCPVLLLSGGDDQNWPSSYSCELLKQRLEDAGYAEPVVWLDYPEAGHLISAPNAVKSGSAKVYHPVRKEFILCGGTPQSNAQASHDSWPKILDFFAGSLAPPA